MKIKNKKWPSTWSSTKWYYHWKFY